MRRFRISNRGQDIGYGAAGAQELVIFFVGAIVLLAVVPMAAEYMRENWLGYESMYGDYALVIGPAQYTMKSLLKNIHIPLQRIAKGAIDGLEDLKDIVGSSINMFTSVLSLIISVLSGHWVIGIAEFSASLMMSEIAPEYQAHTAAGIGASGGSLKGGAVPMGLTLFGQTITMVFEYEIDKVIDTLEPFAVDKDELINVESVGARSTIKVEGTPPDISAILASEIETCRRMGQDPANEGFLICRDAILIKSSEKGECEVAVGDWFESTDECSVTWMLTALYKWGEDPMKSNRVCKNCDTKNGRGVMNYCGAIDTGLLGEGLRIHKSELVDWEENTCLDGKIDGDEECAIRMTYGYNGKIRVSAR